MARVLAQENVARDGRLFDPLYVLDVLRLARAVAFVHGLQYPAGRPQGLRNDISA
jgi:hypothetical protein